MKARRVKRTKQTKQGSSPASTKLERLPPTAPAARDEGPRLIPLDERSKEPSRLEHYLELADTALGLKRGPAHR
jgi:hypothetical protein